MVRLGKVKSGNKVISVRSFDKWYIWYIWYQVKISVVRGKVR